MQVTIRKREIEENPVELKIGRIYRRRSNDDILLGIWASGGKVGLVSLKNPNNIWGAPVHDILLAELDELPKDVVVELVVDAE